jgi:hypothetical protein
MKKLLGFLALAAAAAGAAVVLRNQAQAMPPPPLPVVRIVCDGNIQCCQGSGMTSAGPRQFIYRVKVPTGGLVSVSSVDVGVHMLDVHGLADYVNLVMPAGWTLTAVSGTPPDPGFVCTPHGNVSAIGGNCNVILRFSGPPQTSSFTLAYDFDHNWDVHDANWKASNGNRANWTKPVGLGEGPLHSPMMP